MDHASRGKLLAELASIRSGYVSRVRTWGGADGHEEDVVQEALARAVTGVPGLRDEANIHEWFFRVLRSTYLDFRRRSAVRRRTLVELAREIDVTRQLVADPPELSCECLRRELAALRPAYRRALEIVVLDGRTVAELGALAGITPNNAGVRLHRARMALVREAHACCRGCRDRHDGCSCGERRL